MHMSRLAASVSVGVLLAGYGVVAGAAPASALPYTCAGINGFTDVFDNPGGGFLAFTVSVDFSAGDPLTVTWSDITGTPSGTSLQIPESSQKAFSLTSTDTLSYTFPTDAPGQEVYARLSGDVTGARITITCGASSSSASNSASNSASIPIPPWVQAYGIFHHDDACLTAWTSSWQKWAEPITGGWVCTRTIPSLG